MNYSFHLKIREFELNFNVENFEGSIKDIFNNIEEFIININIQFPELKNLHKYESKVEKQNSIIKAPVEENSKLNEFNKNIIDLSTDSNIDKEKLSLIYDFGSDYVIPTLLIDVSGETRVEGQRNALILLLYANHVINSQD